MVHNLCLHEDMSRVKVLDYKGLWLPLGRLELIVDVKDKLLYRGITRQQRVTRCRRVHHPRRQSRGKTRGENQELDEENQWGIPLGKH